MTKQLDILTLIIVGLMSFLPVISHAGPQPQLKFNFPFFTNPFQNYKRSTSDQMKHYSEYRVSNDSLRMVYHHDLTIAIVELGPNKLLMGCELIEIYDDLEGKQFLHRLTSRVNRPLEIGFREMLKLMKQCNRVEEVDAAKKFSRSEAAAKPVRVQSANEPARRQGNVGETTTTTTEPPNPLTLLNGVVPGTKWCGLGDLAHDYHDLGPDKGVDRCCRTHDICPMKIRGYLSRYNITNDSVYTKSHCVCDDVFYDCLKKQNSVQAQLMGNIYFNLAQVPCIYTSPKTGKMAFRKARQDF